MHVPSLVERVWGREKSIYDCMRAAKLSARSDSSAMREHALVDRAKQVSAVPFNVSSRCVYGITDFFLASRFDRQWYCYHKCI